MKFGTGRAKKAFLAAAALAVSSAAYAHDFFLMPSAFTPPRPGTLDIQATVGSSFPKLENVVTADRVERLYAEGAGSPRLSIVAPASNALDLHLTGTRPGTVVAGVSTKARDVEYAEDRIPIILEEYRVSSQAQAAVEALPRPRTLKVSSRRFAKTIICVQRCGDRSAATKPLGAELEFVMSGKAGDRFRLLKEGRPLGNYPVDLAGSDSKRRHFHTDARGEIRLPADAKGSMMLFSAFMTPPAGGDRFKLDLTSLTLQRR